MKIYSIQTVREGLKSFFIQTIRFYQKTISPDHGLFKHRYPFGYCRFTPSCSEYMIKSIEKYGPIKGMFKGIYRIIKCNPFSKGGWDPVK